MLTEKNLTNVENFHRTAYMEISKTRDEVKDLSIEDLADTGFICNHIASLLDDLRKEFTKLGEFAERMACLKGIETLNMKIQGKLCTAEPELKMSANLPSRSKEPEKYEELCKYLNIPLELLDADLIRIHWPGFTEFFTRLQAEGKPTPPGIDVGKTHAHYFLKYRATK